MPEPKSDAAPPGDSALAVRIREIATRLDR